MDEQFISFLLLKYGTMHRAYVEWAASRWDNTSTPEQDQYMKDFANGDSSS